MPHTHGSVRNSRRSATPQRTGWACHWTAPEVRNGARWAQVPAVFVSRRVDFKVRTNPFSRFKYALPVDRYLCISEGVRAAMLASGRMVARCSFTAVVSFRSCHPYP